MTNNNYFLSSRITALTNGVIQELNNPNKHTISEYEEILRNPWARACCTLKALRLTISLGDYQNENKDIEEFIKENIDNMKGSLPDVVGRLASAMPFGHSAAEIGFKKYKSFRKMQYRLDGINILDPKRIRYAGHYGDITHIKYNDGVRDVWIPYEKCLHVTNGLVTNYNERSVYGYPECEVAYPFVKLYSVIMSEMAVSAKTLATGILVGLADSDNTIQIQDRLGNYQQINAVQHLAEQLKSLENHSHLVTDKKNTVTALQVPSGDQFYNLALNLLQKDIMSSFITPQMVLSEGSGALGMATLSSKQLSVFDASIESLAKQVKDQLIEKVVRPLIIWNFGIQRNYGNFSLTASPDPQTDSLLIQNLVTCFSTGLLQQTDSSAINLLREKLNLPKLSQDTIDNNQVMQQMQQMSQEQGGTPGEEIPPEEQQQYM